MKAKAVLFLIGALIAGMLAFSVENAQAQRKGNDMVVFTANWCAGCRVIVPIVQDIGQQNNMAVHLIDVDRQDAPKLAQSFGLAIPRAELPQVYHAQNGHIKLLYDASNFRYGMEEQVRSTILNNLGR